MPQYPSDGLYPGYVFPGEPLITKRPTRTLIAARTQTASTIAPRTTTRTVIAARSPTRSLIADHRTEVILNV